MYLPVWPPQRPAICNHVAAWLDWGNSAQHVAAIHADGRLWCRNDGNEGNEGNEGRFVGGPPGGSPRYVWPLGT